MSIFQLVTEGTQAPKVAQSLNEKKWVEIGLEYKKAKEKGTTAKQFAEAKGLKYSSFTAAMSRYASAIKLAQKIETLESKPKNKLSKQDRQLIMINSFRSSIREKIRNEGAAVNNKSAKWFADTIKKSVKGHKVAKPQPGKIYAYMYDAKHKDTLPYWDKYPLIIYLGLGKQGSTPLMYGLNLHYIPPKARQQFLEELLKQYASTPTITNNTKLKIDWSKVKGFKGTDKMIKAYLPGHIRGTLMEIAPKDWANVIMLPTQSFQSKGKRFSANTVWKS
ncbi:DNA end protector protein [Escherichia phage vB_EcoM_ESCO47]|nr:DNA end protector protein [Escherichia phage vB_EcoM_ESCO47]